MAKTIIILDKGMNFNIHAGTSNRSLPIHKLSLLSCNFTSFSSGHFVKEG